MLNDDLPWPELGNVSRGATRGNQGQKGVLGSPDAQGRRTIQLRVQPGVLEVTLNSQASEWYAILDGEVNKALKVTKTYWRKARRRQDYDARADQDHMELHEWLQQLKDKTMSHLELLLQKGDIQGPPPYIMSDSLELTFMRKFIERHRAGIPHNPRLRASGVRENPSGAGPSASPTDGKYRLSSDTLVHRSPTTTRQNGRSPALDDFNSLVQEASTSSSRILQNARNAYLNAQRETQQAFLHYTQCREAEAQAHDHMKALENSRPDLLHNLLPGGSPVDQSRHSSVEHDDQRSMNHRFQAFHPQHDLGLSIDHRLSKVMGWQDNGMSNVRGFEQLQDANGRKHAREWDRNDGYGDQYCEGTPPQKNTDYGGAQDNDSLEPPPAKRFNSGALSAMDLLTSVAQTMPLLAA